MPTYAFRCEGCRHEFEVSTPWSKKSEVTCPECGGDRLKELFGTYRLMSVGGGGAAEGGGACAPSGFG